MKKFKKVKLGEFVVNVYKEEGVYRAEVENLPGCFTQAETEEELYQKLQEAIICHLSSFLKDLPAFIKSSSLLSLKNVKV